MILLYTREMNLLCHIENPILIEIMVWKIRKSLVIAVYAINYERIVYICFEKCYNLLCIGVFCESWKAIYQN